MKKFYLTFGQQYPWRNGWVEVEAPDYEKARDYVEEIFGNKWSNLLGEDKFDPSYFPAGKLGETIK
jgi:hypothetical protein